MLKPLANKPVFDAVAFRNRAEDWRRIVQEADSGMGRVVVEWNVARGPSCFVYPAARRALGFDLCADGVSRESDERWADFLEFNFVPQVTGTLTDANLNPQIICTDQRPIQIMREKRHAREDHSAH